MIDQMRNITDTAGRATRRGRRDRERRRHLADTWGVSLPPDSDLKWEIYPKGRKVIMGKRTFSAEYREEAVKMVLETGRPIAAIARDLGINEGTLGNWVNKYRNDHPASEELNISERSRLKELEKENRELRMERDFLKNPFVSRRLWSREKGGARVRSGAA